MLLTSAFLGISFILSCSAQEPEVLDTSASNDTATVPPAGWRWKYRDYGLELRQYSQPLCTRQAMNVFMKDLNDYLFDKHMEVQDPDWRFPGGQIIFSSHQRDAVSIDLKELEDAKAPLTLAAVQEVVLILGKWVGEAEWAPTVHALRLSKGEWENVFAKGGFDCPSPGPGLSAAEIAIA